MKRTETRWIKKKSGEMVQREMWKNLRMKKRRRKKKVRTDKHDITIEEEREAETETEETARRTGDESGEDTDAETEAETRIFPGTTGDVADDEDNGQDSE
jgi:hypothetical protein